MTHWLANKFTDENSELPEGGAIIELQKQYNNQLPNGWIDTPFQNDNSRILKALMIELYQARDDEAFLPYS